ncbi:violacein biosynthesis enzyme VioE [Rivularia sp. PCC 7116]|uniref:violacein biosynthesis enzyme VioE n=1 Tax=Rivularia sp. PCC 7116 TaxID=373994 RepID=UPI00029EFE2C|nr:violacein biosynthesis enzyme VioE [Rivularia sp. PCC 7116]AFY56407.1 violacein biosynthesis enzyme VioE [Rivularia sp. PCC 7116]
MKILIVGAGPAGLIFAYQMKKLKPNWDIKIIEKNKPQEVVGWGVVLPGRAPHHPANPLSYLNDFDQLSAQYLEEFKLVHRNQSNMMSTGLTLCAVERQALVRSLQEHCKQVGIAIDYSSPAMSESDLNRDKYDLVVLSNGISHKSNYFREALKPEIQYGKNKYIWYGTSKTFDFLNLIFKVDPKGVFIAHAYKYSNDMSTFVVECSEETYLNAGLDKLSDADAAAFIGTVFKDELDGHALQGQNGLKWRNFMTMSHSKSYDQNLVLLGDALQSGHFSIGQGTTMAVVGAQMLVKALHEHSDVSSALESFDQKVMPLMNLFRNHADASRLWFENIDSYINLSKTELTASFDARRATLPSLPAALGKNLSQALERTSVKTEPQTPPLLPKQWSTSYVSYWQPMLDEDQITSGYCWFDYSNNLGRIDGLFNPWSEKETGHRLWMSQIFTPGKGETRMSKVAYARKENEQTAYKAVNLEDDVDSCHELLLTQDILIRHNATYAGSHTILGIKTDAWKFKRPGKAVSTYYFKQGTNHLIRMVTGDPNKHASVRDFPNLNTEVISGNIFDYHNNQQS